MAPAGLIYFVLVVFLEAKLFLFRELRKKEKGREERRKEGGRGGKKEQEEERQAVFACGEGASGSAQALGTRPLPVSHYRKRPAKMRNYCRRGWILGLIVLNRSSGAGTQGTSRWR